MFWSVSRVDRAIILGFVVMVGAPAPCNADNQKRAALLIGNFNYESGAVAGEEEFKALAASLRSVGFDRVIKKTDLKKKELVAALQDFSDIAALSDIVLVYYSGEGLELDGRGFLLPIGARMNSSEQAAADGVPLEAALSYVKAPRAYRVVVIDACRKNRLSSDVKAYCMSIGVEH